MIECIHSSDLYEEKKRRRDSEVYAKRISMTNFQQPKQKSNEKRKNVVRNELSVKVKVQTGSKQTDNELIKCV